VDTLATNALAASGAPGLTVAIAKDGMLVYAKAYGTADASTGEPLTLQHRMRVASVSKPITAAAVLQLAESGVLTLDDKVFGFDSWLGETYGTMSYTSDILEITIDHLVNHQAGGWGGNTMFQNPDFSMDEIITWHLDTIPLTNAPGTMFTYSNFGYCLLGRIIEVATGQSYESYLQGTVLAQCGVSDMQIAGDSLAERAANEVVYDEREFGLGRPYGIPVRRMDAHGGWIATATDLLRFMVRMDDLPDPADVVTGASLGDIGWGGAGRSWGHTGQLAGTEAVISRQADGICYAVIANGNGLNPDTLGREMAYAVTDWGSGTPL
jgi:CubicO group peptidase (beta-lactamase class C family)